jgi:X-Pro dipeptidyl-peptidase
MRVHARAALVVVSLLSTVLVRPSVAAPQGPGDYAQRTYEKVRVKVRDGVELSAEIWRPVTPRGVKVPVILHLTPYHALQTLYSGSTDATALPDADAKRYVRQGYAYVLADVRGTWASGGCWDYGGILERHDGYDLVEWLGTRAWSNGRVAMMGVSYPGTTPNATAVERPPHLATIVPMSAISRWWGYSYQQSVRATISGENDDIDPPAVTPADFMAAYGGTPPLDPTAVTSAQQVAMRWSLCSRVEQTLHGYSTQPEYDAFWKERDYLSRAAAVRVPVLVSHGQQDYNVKTWEGTAWYAALRVPKVLVLGQWEHAHPRGKFPEWDELVDKWFARWLYGVRNGVERGPSAYVQTNDREWHAQKVWPAAKVRSYRVSGTSFSYVDDGALTESEMLRGVGGPGVRYTRVPVAVPSGLRFGGRPRLRLPFTSDQPGTHLVAVLLDVGPTATTVVSRAFMNARYLRGPGAGTDLVPGKKYTATLEFIDKDYVLADGHKLELLLASSSSTWVAPDEHRARVTLDLAGARLDLPTYK